MYCVSVLCPLTHSYTYSYYVYIIGVTFVLFFLTCFFCAFVCKKKQRGQSEPLLTFFYSPLAFQKKQRQKPRRISIISTRQAKKWRDSFYYIVSPNFSCDQIFYQYFLVKNISSLSSIIFALSFFLHETYETNAFVSHVSS